MPRASPSDSTANNDKSRRVQLELPGRAFARLDRLKTETEAATYAEVIRNELKLYAALIDHHKAGNTIILQDRDGTTSNLTVFSP